MNSYGTEKTNGPNDCNGANGVLKSWKITVHNINFPESRWYFLLRDLDQPLFLFPPVVVLRYSYIGWLRPVPEGIRLITCSNKKMVDVSQKWRLVYCFDFSATIEIFWSHCTPAQYSTRFVLCCLEQHHIQSIFDCVRPIYTRHKNQVSYTS